MRVAIIGAGGPGGAIGRLLARGPDTRWCSARAGPREASSPSRRRPVACDSGSP
jgi:hypothetical protein